MFYDSPCGPGDAEGSALCAHCLNHVARVATATSSRTRSSDALSQYAAQDEDSQMRLPVVVLVLR